VFTIAGKDSAAEKTFAIIIEFRRSFDFSFSS